MPRQSYNAQQLTSNHVAGTWNTLAKHRFLQIHFTVFVTSLSPVPSGVTTGLSVWWWLGLMFFRTPAQGPTSTWRSSMNVCHTVSNSTNTPCQQTLTTPTPPPSPLPPSPPNPAPLNRQLPSTHTLSHSRVHSLFHSHTLKRSFSRSLSFSLTHAHSHSKPFFSIDSATFQRLREIFTSEMRSARAHKRTADKHSISPALCRVSLYWRSQSHKHTRSQPHKVAA